MNTDNESKENDQKKETENPTLGERVQESYNRHIKPWTWLKDLVVTSIKSIYETITDGIYMGLDAVVSPFKKNKGVYQDSAAASTGSAGKSTKTNYNPLLDNELCSALNENGVSMEIKDGKAIIQLPDFPKDPIALSVSNSHDVFTSQLDAAIRERGQQVLEQRGFQADHNLEHLFNLSESLGFGKRNYSDPLYASKLIDTSNVYMKDGFLCGQGRYRDKNFQFKFDLQKQNLIEVNSGKGSSFSLPDNCIEYLTQCCAQDVKARNKLLNECSFDHLKFSKEKVDGTILYKGQEYIFSFSEKEGFKTSANFPQDIMDAAGREAYAILHNRKEEVPVATKRSEEMRSKKPESGIKNIQINSGGHAGSFELNNQFVDFTYTDGKLNCIPEIKLSENDQITLFKSVVDKQYKQDSQNIRLNSSYKSIDGKPVAEISVFGQKHQVSLDRNGKLECMDPHPKETEAFLPLTASEQKYLETILKEVPAYNMTYSENSFQRYNVLNDKNLMDILKKASPPLDITVDNDNIVIHDKSYGDRTLNDQSDREFSYSTIQYSILNEIDCLNKNNPSGFSSSKEIDTLDKALQDLTGKESSYLKFSEIQFGQDENISGKVTSQKGTFQFEFSEGDVVISQIPGKSSLKDIDLVSFQKQVRDACDKEISFRDSASYNFSEIDLNSGTFHLKDSNKDYSFTFNGVNFASDIKLAPEAEEYLKTICMEQKKFPGTNYTEPKENKIKNFEIHPAAEPKMSEENKLFQTIPFTLNGNDYNFLYNMQDNTYGIKYSDGNVVPASENLLSGNQYRQVKLAAISASVPDADIQLKECHFNNGMGTKGMYSGTYVYHGNTYNFPSKNGKASQRKSMSSDESLYLSRCIGLIPRDGKSYQIKDGTLYQFTNDRSQNKETKLDR